MGALFFGLWSFVIFLRLQPHVYVLSLVIIIGGHVSCYTRLVDDYNIILLCNMWIKLLHMSGHIAMSLY